MQIVSFSGTVHKLHVKFKPRFLFPAACLRVYAVYLVLTKVSHASHRESLIPPFNQKKERKEEWEDGIHAYYVDSSPDMHSLIDLPGGCREVGSVASSLRPTYCRLLLRSSCREQHQVSCRCWHSHMLTRKCYIVHCSKSCQWLYAVSVCCYVEGTVRWNTKRDIANIKSHVPQHYRGICVI